MRNPKKLLHLAIRFFLDMAIILLLMLFVVFLLYFLHGSLELDPTEERQAEIRMVTMLCMILSGMPCALCIYFRVRLGKKKRKAYPDGFVLDGIRPDAGCIRDEYEMETLDKQAADRAFAKYKKEILDPFLLAEGFLKWKSNAYVRMNGIGLLEYINLQKEQHGSRTFCVNFCVMPLYCQEKYMVIGLGDWLGAYISGRDHWWDYGSDEKAKASFENVAEAIRVFLLPWFYELSEEEHYRELLKRDSGKQGIGYDAAKWLAAMDIEDKKGLIEEEIRQLKLPVQLLEKV